MPVSSWSTTPGSNNSAPPNGAPENMAPSAVNDVIRQNMADIKSWYNEVMLYASKTAITNRFSTTTLSADPHLTLSLAASTKYRVEGMLLIGGIGATSSFKYNFSYSGTDIDSFATQKGFVNSTEIASSLAVAYGTVRTFANVEPFGAGCEYVTIDMIFDANAAGTLSLQWAQNSSSLDPIAIERGSWIKATKIS